MERSPMAMHHLWLPMREWRFLPLPVRESDLKAARRVIDMITSR